MYTEVIIMLGSSLSPPFPYRTTHVKDLPERSKKRYRNSRVVPGPSGRIPDVASQLTTLLERAGQRKEGREGG